MFETIKGLIRDIFPARVDEDVLAMAQMESEARFWSGVDTMQRLGCRTEYDPRTRTETRFFQNGTTTQRVFSH